MTDPIERELAVFSTARRLAAGERATYLDEVCAGDAALRRRVEELLLSVEEAGGFLQEPAFGVQRTDAPASPNDGEKDVSAKKAGDRVGRYKLLQQIGEGGCGVVYMAEQEEPVRRRVALKLIKLGMDTKQVIARFEAERQALALMDHPNIAKVLDAGASEAGRPFFVMELVRGRKITEYCDQNHLTTRQRLDLFMQVCGAIQHAHQKGIIHRDIKPSNILVTSDDGVALPKVIDFGIAKATQGRLTDKTVFTAFEQFIGTPAYMSPEQAELNWLDVDTRSDIYSLGVLLYELLTGKTPFDSKELLASGLDAMRQTIREQEPPRPSTRLSTMVDGELTTAASYRHTEPPKLIHDVRGDMDWIVMKCLEKDRSRRYETANGLAMDVERHIANEPVVARPPSNFYRFQKMVRRNKFTFAAGVLVAASMITGLVLFSWQLRRAEEAYDELAIALADTHLERMRSEGRGTLPRVKGNLTGQTSYLSWPSGKRRELRANAEGAQIYETASGVLIVPLFDMRTLIRWAGFSSDESKLFTLSYDLNARLWDAKTGHLLTNPLPHDGEIVFAEFSPDGNLLFTLSEELSASDKPQKRIVAMVWDANSGARVTPTLKADEESIIYARFTDDGKHLVTISEKGSVTVWDARTGRRKSSHAPSRIEIRFHTPLGPGRMTG